jgi:hypothetical protein
LEAAWKGVSTDTSCPHGAIIGKPPCGAMFTKFSWYPSPKSAGDNATNLMECAEANRPHEVQSRPTLLPAAATCDH